MLGKLMKYEIPAIGRRLVPLYGALLIASVMLGLTIRGGSFSNDIIGVLFALIYSGVIAALAVMTLVLIVQRFRQNLLGDGGYFSLTLPVSIGTHIWNKTLSAGLWTFIGGIASLLSALIIVCAAGEVNLLEALAQLLNAGFVTVSEVILIMLEVMVMVFASGGKTALQIYAALSIGHQAKKRTTLASLGAFGGIMVFEYLVMVAVVKSGLWDAIASLRHMFSGDLAQFSVMFVMGTLGTAAFCAVYFAVCRKILSTRLNLQ